MAFATYYDFMLIASDIEQAMPGVVKCFTLTVFDSPVGQGEAREVVTVPDELAMRLRWLDEQNLSLDKQIETGTLLADMLLPPYARQMWNASLARLREGEGLRLRLRFPDALADIPWEFVYLPEPRNEQTAAGFLALNPRISLVRHDALPLPADWFATPTQRRMIVAMASPEGREKLTNLPHEQQLLQAALQSVPGLNVEFYPPVLTPNTPGTTYEALTKAFTDRADIFHFGGHGDFSGTEGNRLGEIVVADEKGQAFAIRADVLAEMMASKGVRLVVLCACETGRRDGQNLWNSVAGSLIKAGIPAVVAMQFAVQDTLATAFSQTFYRALVAGLMVDEAVSLGRAAMRMQALAGDSPDARDWGVPVLSLRAQGNTGSVLFNPVSDVSARDQALKESEALGHKVQQEVQRIAAGGRVTGAKLAVSVERLTVEQKVTEDVAGVLIGAETYSVQNGQITVKQDLNVVSGNVTGLVLSDIGGTDVFSGLPPQFQPSAAMAVQEKQALNQIKAHLAAPTPNAARFCQNCGANLPSGSLFCADCGTKVP